MNIAAFLRQNKSKLRFSLVNAERMESDLVKGITNLKVFSDRVTFTGKLFNDPQVEIRFTDITSLQIEFVPNTQDIGGVVVTGKVSPRTYYRIPPGPDL